MLSPPLLSTYLQYKQDTDFVASWLVTTAKACGYTADLITNPNAATSQPAPSKRLKGKARKEAKGKPDAAAKRPSAINKYIVAVKDFIPLADFIASRQPAVSVPDSFAAALTKVITVRSAFSAKLQEDVTKSLDPRSDESHSYFVGILEKVRASLKPRMSTKASEASTATEEGKLENLFAALTVYEPTTADAAPVAEPKPTAPKPVAQNDVAYEAETQTSSLDALLAYYMLFNDLKKIQTQVRQIWANFKGGLFDPAAAALATNSAIDLARNIIDEILPALRGHKMFDLGSRMHAAFCMSSGYDLKAVTDPAGSNHVAYDLADYTYMNAYTLLESCLSVYDPKHLPLYKPGAFGYYDPTLDRSVLSGAKKFNEDQVLIMEMFTELVTVGLIKNYPVEDEMMRGMKEALKTGHSPFYLVFATQIFLDIHHILREQVPDVAQHVLTQINKIGGIVETHLDFHKNLKIDNWPSSNDQQLRQVIQKVRWIVEDPIHKYKVGTYASMNTPAPPSMQANLMLRSSPVIAGLMLYSFRFEAHGIGIAVANCWGSITYSWHLYNALKSEKLLKGIWKDMEVVYSLLGGPNLHVGETPANTDEYLKRFCLQMGVSASAFTKSRRRVKGPGTVASRAGPRGIGKVIPVNSMFADRYLRRTAQSVDWTPEHIDEILSHSTWQMEGSIEDGNLAMEQRSSSDEQQQQKNKKKKLAKGDLLPAEQLVESLVFALQAETMELAFPWLIMHQLCWGLLRSIKERCNSLLMQMFTPAYMQKESELPWVVGYIFLAAVGLDGGPRDMRLLQLSAGVMDELIEAASDSVLQVVNRHLGLTVEFDDGSEEGDSEDSEDSSEEEGI
ncbi:hypothetical protein QBC44DRAFT_377370 [Cladorrhinum sp. PSN332]|nr:hypothetical protein QBC44DRAFT_377370 [Cladorrhinum sp. PSN332]